MATVVSVLAFCGGFHSFLFGASSGDVLFQANFFAFVLVVLLVALVLYDLVSWLWARRADKKELVLRERLGSARRFRRAAPKALTRLRLSVFATFVVGCCVLYLAFNETEETSRITAVSFEFDNEREDSRLSPTNVVLFAEVNAIKEELQELREQNAILEERNAILEEQNANRGEEDTVLSGNEVIEIEENEGGQSTVHFVPFVESETVARMEEVSQKNARNQKVDRNGNERANDESSDELKDDATWTRAEPLLADSVRDLTAESADARREFKPVRSDAVDEEFFKSSVLASDHSLIEQFSPSRSPDNLNNSSRIRQASSETRAGANSSGAALIDDSVKRQRSTESKSLLERLDDETSLICDSARLCALAIETVKSSSSSQQTERESGCAFLTTYLGRTFALTNYHIVRDAASKDSIKVYLPGEAPVTPVKLFVCPEFDVAVLELDSKQLPTNGSVSFAEFGDSDLLRVGNNIICIGNPFGLEKSVSAGKISSLCRSNRDIIASNREKSQDNLPEFIQLDAAINPGNSGGPLYNSKGQVVGMVTAIATTSGANEGVAFAIPSNVLLRCVKTLVDKGEWRRSRMGIELSQVSRDDLSNTKLNSVFGAKIARVMPNSPASNAGLCAGDVVMAFNGRAVQDDWQLARWIALSDSSEKVRLNVLRGGQFFEIEASVIPSRATLTR